MSTAVELRTPSEKKYFVLAFIVSTIAWLVIVATIFGMLYGILIGLFLFAVHALWIAHIKGNAVRVSKDQFPEIYQRVSEASRKLGLAAAPSAYVMQAGGVLNAFATKFVGRNFMVIYSDLLDACSEGGRELDMIIGHEIGHLALGHLKWIWFLIPRASSRGSARPTHAPANTPATSAGTRQRASSMRPRGGSRSWPRAGSTADR